MTENDAHLRLIAAEAEVQRLRAANARLKDIVKKTTCPWCKYCLGCETPENMWHSKGCPLSPSGD